jgi:hypothetical protein
MKLSGGLLSLLAVLLLTGCEKDPGEGGNSILKGKVMKRVYQAFPVVYTEEPAKDEDIYIIYGDEGNAFDDRTRTSFDGSYKFSTLKKGEYRIFIYSDDTASASFGNKTQVILETEITKNRSETELPVLSIIEL